MNRERLPNRRAAETLDLEIAGLRYTCTIGRFPDGSIAELFLSNHKINSAADTNARDAAIVFSFASANSCRRRAAAGGQFSVRAAAPTVGTLIMSRPPKEIAS